ncbi:UNVERIFIED_CONTAM: hypothetical protein H355_008207 [Colinus virginianus]|nr:hypothetical protein H355_008207 [Colinus virginianus]
MLGEVEVPADGGRAPKSGTVHDPRGTTLNLCLSSTHSVLHLQRQSSLHSGVATWSDESQPAERLYKEESSPEGHSFSHVASLHWFSGPDMFCDFNGKKYSPGESWHPYLEPQGLMYCIRCSCSEEGQIYCGLVTCPELLCSNPLTVPDSCCQVCKDGSHEKSAEEEPLQLNRGVRHSQDQCLGEAAGRKPPGATASTILSSSLEFIPRSFKPKGGGGTTVKIVLKEKHKKACVYNGKTYSHGEVWHPVFRLYGLLPCILCTCRDGVQDCQKITCPKEYPCDSPEKVDGKCCKICPETRVKPTDEIITERCGKNPNHVLVYMFVPPSSENSKEILRTVAIEKELTEEVEIYNWKLIKGIFHLIQTKKISKQEFKQEAQNFRLITRTNEGHWNIFQAQTSELRMTESPEKETKNL